MAACAYQAQQRLRMSQMSEWLLQQKASAVLAKRSHVVRISDDEAYSSELLQRACRLATEVLTMLPRRCAGGATSVAAGRVSYTFGLKGPCVSIDTACSSSLVGMHYGSRDVADNVCDRALAAGVNLTLNPGKTAAFTVTGEP